MYRIVTGQQMADIDRISIEERKIRGERLMENAGQGIVRFIVSNCLATPGEQVVVLCGKGNNGGDGLVIARGLYEYGIRPSLFLFGSPEQLKGDAALNWSRLPDQVIQQAVVTDPNQPLPDSLLLELPETALIIDALFGTGLRGPLRENWDSLLQPFVPYQEKILAVDIPSGIDANTGQAEGPYMSARWTVTMGLPKVGHLVGDGLDATGNLTVIDIGFPEDLTTATKGENLFLEAEDISPLLPRRKVSAHKGAAGRVLVLAGSTGMTGAATLCSQAALEVGAGLVTLGIPCSLNPILETKLTEVMTLPLPETDQGTLSESALEKVLTTASSCQALALGPGLGRSASTGKLVREVIRKLDCPLLLDADALYALAEEPEIVAGKQAILTPHPGEMANLVGKTIDEVKSRRWEIARETAKKWGVTIVLKGARTVIASPNGAIRINSTGNPAMASAGMGDVLSGITAGLLTQGLAPFDAAQAAVFVHGLAADLWIQETGYPVITAQEVLDWSREAIRVLLNREWNRSLTPPPRIGAVNPQRRDT